MGYQPVFECQCSVCRAAGKNGDTNGADTRDAHRAINVFLSQLDEFQARLWVGLESKKRGQGSERLLSLITGIDELTIAVGRREIEIALGNVKPTEAEAQRSLEAKAAKQLKIGSLKQHGPFTQYCTFRENLSYAK